MASAFPPPYRLGPPVQGADDDWVLGEGFDVAPLEYQTDALMRAINPNGVPQYQQQQSPALRLGRFSIPGEGLDAAALAILQQLQAAPRRPRNFGEGLLQGAIGGFAGARAQGAERRQKFNEEQRQRQVKAEDEARGERSKAAFTLRRWQLDERARKQREADDSVLVTPDVHKRLKAQGIYVDESLIGQRVGRGTLVRDMPIERPVAELSPAARKFWGQRAAAMGGQLPPGVARNQKLVTQILEETAAEAGKTGMSGYDMAGALAKYKASTKSLAETQVAKDASEAFAGLAHRNAGIARDLIRKIKDSGVTWTNTPVRALVRGLGSVEQAQFNAAIVVLRPEFARLLSSVNMKGVLTNEARNEIKDILSTSYTIPQLEGALDILEMDADNRVSAYSEKVSEIEARLSSRPSNKSADIDSTLNRILR